MRRPWCLPVLGLVVAGCAATVGTADPSPSTHGGDGTVATVETGAAPTGPTVPPPPTARAVSTTSVATEPALPTITIAVAGDTAFTHGLAERDPLGDIADILGGSDLTIVNLETTVAEPEIGSPIDKVYTFKSPPVTGDLLAAAGVDVAALANNHALDYGPEAVLRTIEILHAAGVATAGTGPDPAAAYAATRIDVRGWDVAVLSFSRVPCDSPEPGEEWIPEIAWACPHHLDATDDAIGAAADADLVIVMAHWGIERQVCPVPHQRELAERWIGSGADLVVGSHPHVLQGVERIDDAWVLYSTGNFAFPSARQASSHTAVFEFTVGADDSRLTAHPVRIVDGRPLPAQDSRPGILADLTARSLGWAFDDAGEAMPTDRPGGC